MLVVVVYVALTSGPVSGMLAGSVAGLIQDRAVERRDRHRRAGEVDRRVPGGAIGQQFIVTAALPRFVMFVGATAVHAAVFMGLYVVLGLRTFPSPWKADREPGAGQRARRDGCVHDHRVAAGRGRAAAVGRTPRH